MNCPAGNFHFQGYVEFNKPYKISGLKKILYAAHWERRQGTRDQARDYCMKNDETSRDGPWEIGTWTAIAGKQGARSDLLVVCQLLKEGVPMPTLALDHPDVFVKYSRGLEKLQTFLSLPRPEPPEVILCYGEPGCGKTRLVRNSCDSSELYTDPIGAGAWFDGYNGEPHALFDDFDGCMSHVRLKDFLRIIDRYDGLRVPIKGGFVIWAPRTIWITSNYHPRTWWDWSNREVQYPALQRRFTKVYHWRRGTRVPETIVPECDTNWSLWWKGPLSQAQAEPGEMGPMDLWVDHYVGTRTDDFDFITFDD